MSLTHSMGGGSGQEAVPVLADGMRAPPATEAANVDNSFSLSSRSMKSNIPPEVSVKILGVHDIDAAVCVGFANLLTSDIDAAVGINEESGVLTEADVEEESAIVGETDVDEESAIVGEIDVEIFAALLSPSGFTGQSFRLFLLLPVPPEFRQRSVPGSV